MPGLSKEKQVGIFLVITILLTIGLIVLMGKIRPFRKGYEMKATFHHAGGLAPGDEVQLAGMKVGEVTDLVLKEDKIVVTLWVRPGTRIREDSVVTVSQASIMGGKYVAISLGSPSSPQVPPGSVIDGIDPTEMGDVIAKVKELGDDIQDAIRRLTKSFTRTADTFTATVEDNRENIKTLISSLKEIAEKIESGEGTIGKLVQEEEVYNDLKEAVKEAKKVACKASKTIEKVGPDLESTMKSVKVITKRLEEGEGTIGKLLVSEEMYDKAVDTIDSAKTTLVSAKSTMGSIEETSDNAGKIVKKMNQIRTVLGYDGDYVSGENGMRHAGYIRIEPSSSKYYLIGASTEPWEECAKGTLQLAHKFFEDTLTIRGGIIEASGGVGLDYELPWENTSVTLEGFQDSRDEKAYMRLRFNYQIWKNYYLTIGAADFTDDPLFTFGVRIEYDDRDLKYLVGAAGMAR